MAMSDPIVDRVADIEIAMDGFHPGWRDNAKPFPPGPHTETLILPFGETWVLSDVAEMEASLLVLGEFRMEPGSELRFVGIDEANYLGGGMEPMPDTDIGLWVFDAGLLNLDGFVIGGTPEGRAHVWIRNLVPTQHRIANGKIAWCGPQQDFDADGDTEGVPGRIPMHFHQCGDNSRGSKVEAVTVSDSGNHAFWFHGSHGVSATDSKALRVQGEAWGWNLGDRSDDILWERCHAEQVMAYDGDRSYHLGAFLLLQGEGNRCIDCSAKNCQGQRENAGAHWHSSANNPPNNWEFRGFRVDGSNDAGKHVMGGTRVWQNTPSAHIVSDVIVNDAKFGIAHGAYRNSYQYQRYQINRCDVGIILHAVSKDVQRPDGYGLTFEDMTIQDCPAGILIRKHTLPEFRPTLFKDLRISGAPQPIRINHKARSPRAGFYDFVGVTVEGADLAQEHFTREIVGPGTVIRVQRVDGSAYQIDDSGVANIVPFYAEVT